MTYTTSRYTRRPRANWDAIKYQVEDIERRCFGDKAWSRDRLAQELNRATRVTILLWITDPDGVLAPTLIGYTVAEPWPSFEGQKTAYVGNTAITPLHQGRGCVALMLRALYHELRAEGYAIVERDAAVANGYAWNIVKHASVSGDLLTTKPHDSSYGPQLFIRMKVPSDGPRPPVDHGVLRPGPVLDGDPDVAPPPA